MILTIFLTLKIFISLIFLTIASYQDLKTTEINDLLLYAFLIFSILINVLEGLLSKNFEIIINSLLNGIFASFIAFLLYYFGFWGAGDSFLLSSICFLNILNRKAFFLVYFLILGIVGFVYGIFYSLFLFIKNRKKIKFQTNEKKIIFLSSISFCLFLLFSLFSKLFLIPFFLFLFITFSIFFNKIERDWMIKKIATKNLKVGDVLLESKKWVGITESELRKIRKKYKFVYIKEGIRFAPSFLISFIVYLIFESFEFNLLTLLLLF